MLKFADDSKVICPIEKEGKLSNFTGRSRQITRLVK